MQTKRHLLICLLLISCLSISVSVFANRAIQHKDANSNKEKRLALVIGNSDYKDSPLKNPVNDAGDMAQTLKATGFKVKLLQNANQREMEKAIRRFGKDLRSSGGVGLFYFAGHGIQFQGVNYLVPLKASIESEADVEYEAVDAGRVLSQMEGAGNKINIVILDACRNNPFARSFRSASKGLARMDAPTGSIIAYATAPGSVAADGRGRNGVYTKYLLQHLSNPGVAIEMVFKKVRQSVLKETGNEQTPWESSSLTGNFYFMGSGGSDQGSGSGSTEMIYWQTVAESNDKKQLKSYLQQYPNGIFASVARDKIKQLDRPVLVSTGGGNNGGNQAMEAAYWQSVSGGELELVQSYLDQYPNGGFVALASRQVEKHLKSSKDLELLLAYLTESRGRFEDVASHRIEKLLKGSKDWDLLRRYKTEAGGRFSAIVTEKLAAKKRAAKHRAAEKLAAEKRAAEKRVAAEKLAAEKLAAEKQTAEKQAADKKRAEENYLASLGLVKVKGGCFQMGNTFDGFFEDGEDNELPVHEVCVDSFQMGKYEVTQGIWQQVMGSNPSHFKKGDNYPVEQVSWNDVQDFLKRLNKKTGRRFRLPTEAEWEYAARSQGKKEQYAGGNSVDSVAWYDGNSGESTHPVGQKAPNGLGLYDMSGNLLEWCSGWYGQKYYSSSPRNNPRGASSGSNRVVRSGGCGSYPKDVRAARRRGLEPGFRSNLLGFRLVFSEGI